MLLIGISGTKYSGKDSTLDCIRNHFKHFKVARVAFADPLKAEVSEACGVSLEYLEAHKDNFRLILQGWGTDYKRKLVKEDYWICKCLQKLSKVEEDIVVIPDVRFMNEAMCLRNIGGYLWHISRPLTGMDDYHESERKLDIKWDEEILNTGTLLDLQRDITLRLSKYKL